MPDRELYADAPVRFFAAWKRGVALAGYSYFGAGTVAGYESAQDKDDLRPDYDLIADVMGVLSSGEAKFLAAMYSFFDAEYGGELLRRAGVRGLADLAGVLDREHLQVIADLLLDYSGW